MSFGNGALDRTGSRVDWRDSQLAAQQGWGYTPGGVVGAILVVVVILLLTGRL